MNKKKLMIIIGSAAVVLIAALIITISLINSECKHSYSDWKVSVDATCINEGKKIRTCKKCGEVETENIEPLGHIDVDDDGNCITPVVCPRCNNEILAGKLEHNDTDHDYICNNPGCSMTVEGAPKDEDTGYDLPIDKN